MIYTPASQYDDLQARWTRAKVRYARASATVERSQRLISWSRIATKRYKASRISGGSGDLDHVLEHLRSLIEDGTLAARPPKKTFAGPNNDGHSCLACGVKLTPGEIEFEVASQSGAPVFFHRRCIELWRQAEQRA